MPKPIPGQQWTVGPGDSLESLSVRAYGNRAFWPRIWKANQNRLRSSNPNIIFDGEVILIPELTEQKTLVGEQEVRTAFSALTIKGKGKDDFTLLVDDIEIPVESGRVIRTMDTAADAWSARIQWQPGRDPLIDERLLPYKYPKASVYLGDHLIVNGLLYSVIPEQSEEGIVKNLEGASFTADAIDSTLRPPYEVNNVTLEQRANDLVRPLGIKAVFEFPSGGPFKRMTASKTDTIFSHLAKYASQRGLLISSTESGDMLFTKASEAAPIAIVEEEKPFPEKWQARFDGRARFNVYRALSQGPRKNKRVGIAKDDNVPRARFLTFAANDSTKGNVKKAAEWRRSKQIADALSIPFPVSSWYTPDGDLWQENSIVTVISPTIHVPSGFDFLIKSVEYVFDNNGTKASLNIVPPQVYTGEPLVDPWSII
jgi:prophage tail gpP-like protein